MNKPEHSPPSWWTGVYYMQALGWGPCSVLPAVVHLLFPSHWWVTRLSEGAKTLLVSQTHPALSHEKLLFSQGGEWSNNFIILTNIPLYLFLICKKRWSHQMGREGQQKIPYGENKLWGVSLDSFPLTDTGIRFPSLRHVFLLEFTHGPFTG